MIIVSASQFHVYLPRGQRLFSVLNVKAVVAAFNQEKALVGAFSVIVQLHRLIVYSTTEHCIAWWIELRNNTPAWSWLLILRGVKIICHLHYVSNARMIIRSLTPGDALLIPATSAIQPARVRVVRVLRTQHPAPVTDRYLHLWWVNK